MERKLMELADLVTNRPNGAEIFHREREACVELAGRLAPGIVEKLQGLPFRANTKGKHGGALDKIIAELKAGEPHRPEAKCPDPPPHDLGAGKRKLPKAAAKREAKGKAQPRPRAARKQAVAEAKPEAVSADPPAAPAPPSGEAKQAALTSFFKSKAVDAVATAPAAPPEAPDMAAAGIDLESYYKELELCPGASLREINTAYRKRALQTHPDKGGSSASFRRVQAAYVALTDSLRKAEEETSLSECSDRLFAALLLRGECPADELKLYKIEVLRKFKDKLQAMSKQMQVTMDVELDENNSKGLSRNRTGFAVDVSWRSFRMRATHIPTLEQALAIHVAAVTTRQRALARFNMYLERRRATGQMGKTAEEVHPLERQELEALMAEAPWTFQFASDVHGKTRVMSPWTPCLASALEFRGLIYAAIDAAKEAKERPGNMTRIATLKKQMAKEAAQHREDAPRARAALLEAIDQCIEAEPARPSEAIPQQTKAIEASQGPTYRPNTSLPA
ncbi:SEC63 [Symbiodinium sp. CCMP2592]|nr:SEC63 [Symbiodinium sp. CCMP2592]